MTASLLVDTGPAQVWHADWRSLLDVLPRREDGTVADTMCVDAPYSERTHKGHDGGAITANRAADYSGRSSGSEKDRRYAAKKAATGEQHRRELSYPAWTASDVENFVAAWSPVVRGWIVSLTDDVLFGAWRSSLANSDRQTFQDIPCVMRGMSVRFVGDGPSSWAVHAAVARPRTAAAAAWGTLDGAYVGPYGRSDVVGGKPEWLMSALVRDYTRPGDLVLDPCCGAGTTGVAAVRLGRRFIGGDPMREHAELAAKRLAPVREQRRLFDTLDWSDPSVEPAQ